MKLLGIFLCFCASSVQVMVDVDGKGEWRACADITGLRLPIGYYFGASSATGELSGVKSQQSPGGLITCLHVNDLKLHAYQTLSKRVSKRFPLN